MADKKPTPVHRVLYLVRADGSKHPLATHEEGERDGDLLFLAIMVDEINKARRSGAPVPEFRQVSEHEGKEVENRNG